MNHQHSLALTRNFLIRYFVFEQAARLLGSEAETLDRRYYYANLHASVLLRQVLHVSLLIDQKVAK